MLANTTRAPEEKEKERSTVEYFFKQKTAYEISECDWSS
eukprot:SAG31_NODE_46114_length_256_cov_0.388535_1_plen_38_part_01